MTFVGTASILVIALLGRRIASPRVGIVAAFIAALYPNLWINDGMLLVETVYILAIAVTLLLTYRYLAQPRWGDLVGLSAALTAAAMTRPESLVLFGVVVTPLVLTRTSLRWSQRLTQLAVAALVPIAAFAAVGDLQPHQVRQPGHHQHRRRSDTRRGLLRLDLLGPARRLVRRAVRARPLGRRTRCRPDRPRRRVAGRRTRVPVGAPQRDAPCDGDQGGARLAPVRRRAEPGAGRVDRVPGRRRAQRRPLPWWPRRCGRTSRWCPWRSAAASCCGVAVCPSGHCWSNPRSSPWWRRSPSASPATVRAPRSPWSSWRRSPSSRRSSGSCGAERPASGPDQHTEGVSIDGDRSSRT